jgi:class 3 adenylate cyclase
MKKYTYAQLRAHLVGLILFASSFFCFQSPQELDQQIANALKIKDYTAASRLSIKAGEAYTEATNINIAEKCYRNAIDYATKSGDKALMAYSYEMNGDFFLPNLAYPSKVKNYQIAENLYRKSKDYQGLSSVLKKLTKHSFEQKKETTALKYGKLLLDSVGYLAVSEFEKLNLTKALLTISMNTQNVGDVKKYLQIQLTIDKNAVLSTNYNPDTDFDEEILKNEYAKALQKTTREIQDLVRSQENVSNTNNQKGENRLSELQQREIEAKWQKEIIAKQQELSRLQGVENDRLIIGIIGSLLVFVISVIALIGRQIANRKLAKQKAEIEKQKALIDEERKKAEALLLNILPKEIADELKEKGYAMPRSYQIVTVLFTDFKGFTQIAEKLTPQETVERLNFFFQIFDEISKRHNLEKIKTLGDGYMCAGGVPNENSTNPIEAVRAGLEMQQFMREWNEERIANGESTFELRLGINTGALVAGVIGTNKFAYDIWGDTVNLASRMESSGEIGKVNISGATYEWVRDYFVCTYRGKVAAKNKGEVDMYFVEGEK